MAQGGWHRGDGTEGLAQRGWHRGDGTESDHSVVCANLGCTPQIVQPLHSERMTSSGAVHPKIPSGRLSSLAPGLEAGFKCQLALKAPGIP